MPHPIASPANFVPSGAIAFDDGTGEARFVSAAAPLPTISIAAAAGSSPLAGTMAQSGVAGPFTPVPGAPIWITLSGSWTGSVRLLRSLDGGVTQLPLTMAGEAWGVFTRNANEAVADPGGSASFYVEATLTGGAVTYRVAQ